MIFQRELRKGIYFTDAKNRLRQVHGFDNNGIIVGSCMAAKSSIGGKDYNHGFGDMQAEEIKEYVNYGDAKAIPLTVEWLQKLGFEVKNSGWVGERYYAPVKEGFDLDLNFIRFEDGVVNYYTGCFANGHDGAHFVEVKYVHQLQNLYFAVTGEELAIKEIA